MPRFAFEARDASGAAVQGVEMARDERELDHRLQEGDLLLVKASRVQEKRRKTSSTRELVDFCYHLAVVIEAGIPILEGLNDLADSEHPLHLTIRDVARKVESGSTFSAALDDHPEHFPDLLRRLIGAGEESGALDVVLKDLVAYLEWREALRRQISSAATYPVMVIVGIVGLVTLLTVWVLPRFLDIFSELGAALPPTTRAMIWMHDFLVAWWLHVIVVAVAGFVGASLALRKEEVLVRVHAVLLKLPVLGSLILMTETSRFAHNLGLLLGTGIPLLRSLRMVEDVVQNRVVRETVRRTRERVEQGSTLTNALGHSDTMPSLVMRMISVGESSGRIEESLERVSAYYDREIPVLVSRALAFFNTATMILLGATLVTVALSIFGPLYQMMGELNG